MKLFWSLAKKDRVETDTRLRTFGLQAELNRLETAQIEDIRVPVRFGRGETDLRLKTFRRPNTEGRMTHENEIVIVPDRAFHIQMEERLTSEIILDPDRTVYTPDRRHAYK